MWIIYLIENSYTKELYFGITNNFKRRLLEHNSGKNASTNRKNGEWILIYAEAYRDKNDAILREQRLKQHGRGKQELLKRLSNSKL